MSIRDLDDVSTITGQPVIGAGGSKLGRVDAIYPDVSTTRPEWAAVKTGILGNHVSIVPLAEAAYDGDELRVPYSKAQVKAAPHHDPKQSLSRQNTTELCSHYGLSDGAVALPQPTPIAKPKLDAPTSKAKHRR